MEEGEDKQEVEEEDESEEGVAADETEDVPDGRLT